MKKSRIIGIISILVLVIFLSGCTSEYENTYLSDIQLYSASYKYPLLNGSARGECSILNEGSVTYKQVKINLEIYDENGTIVGNATRTLDQIRSCEHIDNFIITEKAFPNGRSASATVINATPVT